MRSTPGGSSGGAARPLVVGACGALTLLVADALLALAGGPDATVWSWGLAVGGGLALAGSVGLERLAGASGFVPLARAGGFALLGYALGLLAIWAIYGIALGLA